MSNKELSPLQQANRDVPKGWYETSHQVHQVLMVGSALAFHFANIEIFHQDSLPVHIIAATLFVLSSLADRYSTVQGLKANILAEQSGIKAGGKEQNIFLSDMQDPKKFMHSKKTLVIDLIGTAISATYPGIGVGFALGKVQAAANNLRAAKRIDRAVEIVKNKQLVG